MSDAVEMVWDRRRADSLSGCRPLGLTSFRCVARRRSGMSGVTLKGAWQHPRPSRVRRRSTEITRLRCHAETQDYIARKRTEGKNTKEAIRCLKRHLTRRLWHLLQPPHPETGKINLLT